MSAETKLTKMKKVSPHTHFATLLHPVFLFPFSTGHWAYSQMQAIEQCTWKGCLATRGVSIPKEALLFSALRTFQSAHRQSERKIPNGTESPPRCLQRHTDSWAIVLGLTDTLPSSGILFRLCHNFYSENL